MATATKAAISTITNVASFMRDNPVCANLLMKAIQGSGENVIRDDMKNLINTSINGSGEGTCCGGFEDVIEKNNMEARTQAKNDIIKRLATGLKTAGLKSQDGSIDWGSLDPNAAPDDLIKQINKQLDFAKANFKFSDNKELNTKIIINLAKIINQALQTDIQIKGRTPSAVARDIFGIMTILSVGMTSDYVKIYAYLRGVSDRTKYLVKSLQAAATELKDIFDKKDKLESSRNKISNIIEAINVLTTEATSEHRRLAGLLEPFRDPSSPFYVDTNYENKQVDANTLAVLKSISDSDFSENPREYREKVMQALGLINTAMTQAHRVDKFLRTFKDKLGNDYMREKFLGKSNEEFEKFTDELSKDITIIKTEVNDPLNKVNSLYDVLTELVKLRRSGDYTELRPMIEEFGKDGDNAGFSMDFAKESVTGSAEEIKRSNLIAKRIEQIKRQKEQLSDIGTKDLYVRFTALIGHIQTLVTRMRNGEIKYSDNILQFGDTLVPFEELDDGGAAKLKALIGYKPEHTYVAHRDNFISNIRRLIQIADTLNKPESGSGYAVFGEISQVATSILTTIDQSYDRMREHHKSSTLVSNYSPTIGSAEPGKNTPAINTLIDTLKTQLQNFNFEVLRIQGMEGIGRGSKLIKEGQEEMADIRTRGIGNKVAEVKASMEKELKDLESAEVEGFLNAYKDETVARAIGIRTAGDAKEPSAVKKSIIDSIRESHMAVINLYKAAENLDIILQKFVLRVSENPNTMKDLNKLINNQVDIANWYSDASGDELAKFFESFPSNIASTKDVGNTAIVGLTASATGTAIANAAAAQSNSHYYEKVSAAVAADAAKAVADPSLPAAASDYKKLHEIVDRSVGSIAAIKNLVGLFYRVLEESGGNAATDGFLSPTTFFKYLREYVIASALVNGYPNAREDRESLQAVPYLDSMDNYEQVNDDASKTRLRLTSSNISEDLIKYAYAGEEYMGILFDATKPLVLINDAVKNIYAKFVTDNNATAKDITDYKAALLAYKTKITTAGLDISLSPLIKLFDDEIIKIDTINAIIAGANNIYTAYIGEKTYLDNNVLLRTAIIELHNTDQYSMKYPGLTIIMKNPAYLYVYDPYVSIIFANIFLGGLPASTTKDKIVDYIKKLTTEMKKIVTSTNKGDKIKALKSIISIYGSLIIYI